MNVSELTGAQLDYWVAKAEGLTAFPGAGFPAGTYAWVEYEDHVSVGTFMPSSSWRQGGPIIERERIELQWSAGAWGANLCPADPAEGNSIWPGPTPLTAAMRAYVASKFGEDVPLEESAPVRKLPDN